MGRVESEEVNQVERGLERTGLRREDWENLGPEERRIVFEAGCSAGGMREFVCNYDGSVGVKAEIDKLRNLGYSPVQIFCKLFLKK